MKSKHNIIMSIGTAIGLTLLSSIALANPAPAVSIDSSVGNSIQSIVATILDNNLKLKELSAANEAEVLELQTENVVGPTSIEYSPFFRSGVTGLASSELIVKQEFDFPTQYSARSNAIHQKRVVLDANLSRQRREISIEAIQGCIDWIALKREREILLMRLNSTDTILDLYERRYELRAASLLEVNKIRLSKQDLEREILENKASASEIESQLTLLNAGKPLDLHGLEYAENLKDIPIPSSVADYVAQLPSVKAAEAEANSATKELGIAGNSWLPTISVGYRRNTEISEASNGFLIGIDFPLFSFGKLKKAAQAKKAASDINLDASINAEETEAETTLNRLKLIRETINAYDLSLITQTLDLYHQSLELGQITLTEYYQEVDQLYDRLLTRTRLEHDYRRLAATLTIGN